MRKITKKVKPKYFTGYLRRVFDIGQYPTIVNELEKKIITFQKKHSFDAIAFTGISGCAVAFTLAYKLKVPLICIRKRSDNSHFSGLYEGIENIKRYIIVDDFISSGTTIQNIKKNIAARSSRAKLVGIFLYGEHENRTKYKNIPVYHIP